MDRKELRAQLEAGRSLGEIARSSGKDRSTIGKLAKRYGLVPPGRSKYAAKSIDPRLLQELVERGRLAREIATELGVSPTTVRKHVARLGLQAVGRHRRVRSGESTPLQRRIVMRCSHHGLTGFQLDSGGSYRCLRCRSEAVMRRRRKVKAFLVGEAGGSCRLCGYHRCLGALHFHHLDPERKDFGLSHRGFTKSLEKLRAEASKCVLLCSNCHAEVETGIASL